MKSMSKAFLILVATALVGTGFSTRAEAAAITIANVVITATTVDADVVVSDLNEATGGFSALVTYNPVDFTGATYGLDPGNKLGNSGDLDLTNDVGDFSLGFGGGVLDLFVLAGYSPAALVVAQGPFPASFVLAHVQFTRSSPTAGTDLGLAGLALSNADGTALIPLGNVPEPTSMLLFSAGLATLVARRRMQNKA